MTAFASADDVAALLRRPLSNEERTAADLLLASASEAIRGYTRQTISAVADDVALLRGNWTPRLVLPERPVSAVTVVAVGPTTLTAGVDYTWVGLDELLRGPALTAGQTAEIGRSGHWGGRDAIVRVTYSHGYATIPDDVRGVCLDLVERRLTRPVGVVKEDIGAYKVAYDPTEPSGMNLLRGDRDRLRRYRRSSS